LYASEDEKVTVGTDGTLTIESSTKAGEAADADMLAN